MCTVPSVVDTGFRTARMRYWTQQERPKTLPAVECGDGALGINRELTVEQVVHSRLQSIMLQTPEEGKSTRQAWLWVRLLM